MNVNYQEQLEGIEMLDVGLAWERHSSRYGVPSFIHVITVLS